MGSTKIRRAARGAMAAAVAVLLVAGMPSAGAAQEEMTTLIITNGDPDNSLYTVCTDNELLAVAEYGNYVEKELVSGGSLRLYIYVGELDACPSQPAPDRFALVHMTPDEPVGVAIGPDSAFEFDLDESCLMSGLSRGVVVNTSAYDGPVDVWAKGHFGASLIAVDLAPGTASSYERGADDFWLTVHAAGQGPDSPTLGHAALLLPKGYAVTTVLTGPLDGDVAGFSYKRGPFTCRDEPSTPVTTSSSVPADTVPSTAVEPAGTGTASPATPVSGSVAYAG